MYIFIDDKLVRGRYSIQERHTDPNKYISDYAALVEVIENKYGEPDIDDSTWHNDLFKDDRSSYDLAVSAGHLSLTSLWRLDDTEIAVALMGDNYEVTLLV